MCPADAATLLPSMVLSQCPRPAVAGVASETLELSAAAGVGLF